MAAQICAAFLFLIIFFITFVMNFKTNSQMKNLFSCLYISALLIVCFSCKEKKATQEIIVTKVVEQKISETPVKMQEYTQTSEVKWGGSVVKCQIIRTPDETIAMVKDENGQKYVDNRIKISIFGNDGNALYDRSFTKADFTAYIEESYKTGGILEGLVFDKISNDTLFFAASVCLPQTDEYIPLILSISKSGNVSIERDTTMDTVNESAEEDI
jgi:hypothetical protein